MSLENFNMSFLEVKKIIIKKVLKLPETEIKNLVLVNFDGKKTF